jgi:glyoxylase-like metal-dependent hydrolase (beta-lactamase superfamily II)
MTVTRIQSNEMGSNSYILLDGESGEGAVIDVGSFSPELQTAIAQSGIKQLKYILLTHGHFDHILGVHDLKEKYPDARIAIHREDAVSLYDPEESLASTSSVVQKPAKADIILEDGDEISIGKNVLRVMHTPGHTMGSVCYILEPEHMIFSGDTLFCRTVGRTDLRGGNWSDLLASLERLMSLEGDYEVFPGHNRQTSLAVERVSNRYLRKK